MIPILYPPSYKSDVLTLESTRTADTDSDERDIQNARNAEGDSKDAGDDKHTTQTE